MSHIPHRNRSQYSINDLKRSASGRWREILTAAGMPAESLDRRGKPCPKCGGRDRFALLPDFDNRGSLICRNCHNALSNPRSGDGLASLRWWLGLSLSDAIRWLGDYLEARDPMPRVQEVVQSIPVKTQSIDPDWFSLFADICRRNMRPGWLVRAAALLGLSPEPLAKLGVGWSPSHKATSWPMRDDSGEVIGIRLRCPKTAQKWAVKWSLAGLFYDPALLSLERPGRLWIAEGPSDTAAILSLGVDVVGVPSAGGGGDLLIDLARRILPGEIVIVADADDAGIRGAERIADALVIIAPVRIVTPPNGLKDARAWVCSGANREVIESAADAAILRRVVMGGE